VDGPAYVICHDNCNDVIAVQSMAKYEPLLRFLPTGRIISISGRAAHEVTGPRRCFLPRKGPSDSTGPQAVGRRLAGCDDSTYDGAYHRALPLLRSPVSPLPAIRKDDS
jgi:hypothetical protein